MPALRVVLTNIPDLSLLPGFSAVVTALTKPLSPEEEFPVFREEKLPRIVFKGNLEEGFTSSKEGLELWYAYYSANRRSC
ncbi:MAG: hypothetical protein QXI67_07595 [Candidatus Bathyarchaeia archaeon]